MTWEARLSDIAALVAGKRVALLGSAPGDHEIPPHDVIAAVNGSAAAFGISHVDIHFLNSGSLKGQGEIHKAVRAAMSGLSATNRVFIDAADLKTPVCGTGESLVNVSRQERPSLYAWATGEPVAAGAWGEQVVSTGIAAALILRKLGARVSLVGFSGDDGHVLLDGSSRCHRQMDAPWLRMFGIRVDETRKEGEE